MLPSERTSYDKNKVHSHPVLRVSSAGEERKLKNRKIHSRKYSREIVKRRQALSGKGTCVNIGLPRIGRLGVGKSNSKGHDTRAIDHPANAMGFPDGDCRRFDSSSVHWPGKETGRHIDWDFASRFPLARQQSGGCTPRESSSRPRVAVPRSPQIGFTNRREVGGVWDSRRPGMGATMRITKRKGSANFRYVPNQRHPLARAQAQGGGPLRRVVWRGAEWGF